MNPRSLLFRLTATITAAIVVSAALMAIFADAFFRRSQARQVRLQLADAISALGGEWQAEVSEIQDLRRAAEDCEREMRLSGVRFALLDREGNVLAGTMENLPAARRDLEPALTFSALPDGRSVATAPFFGGTPHRLEGWIVVHEHERRPLVRQLHQALAKALAISLVIGIAGGSLMVRRSLLPAVTMARRAREIVAAGALHADLDIQGPERQDEIGDLARAFNELLRRLRRSLEEQRRFLSDAAHELRTPLAGLLAEMEVALSVRERSRDELRTALESMADDIKRMRRVLDDLLLLARGDEMPVPRADYCYLADVVSDVARVLNPLAAARCQELRVKLDGEGFVRGDERLLARLVTSLVENAIKFGRERGIVAITLEAARDGLVLIVDDDGPGIAPEHMPWVFERFYRAIDAGDVQGAGLGLAIVKEITRLHGGSARAENRPGGGARFTVTLPAAEPAHASVPSETT